MEIEEREVRVCEQTIHFSDGKPLFPPVQTVLLLQGRGLTSSLTSEWSRTVRELQSVGHRAVVVGLPGGYVTNKEQLMLGVLEVLEESQAEVDGVTDKDHRKVVGVESQVEVDGVTAKVHGKVVGVSVGGSGNFVLPLLETGKLAGWVCVSPTSAPPTTTLPILLVYGEEEVKSRSICEKILRNRQSENVRCVMLRGGDLQTDHMPWVKLLKKFLADL